MANTIRLKRASGSDPGASDLVTGELAVRTDNGKLFTKKDDNSVSEIGGGLSNIVEDSSPQLGGNLDTNGNNIVFGDSGGTSDDRLVFGASSDLQIYHNGNNGDSAIVNSTGDLFITNNGDDLFLQGLDDVVIKTQGGADVSIQCFGNGGTELYCDNIKRLETTSEGVNVTGDLVTSDDVIINGTTNDESVLRFYDGGAGSWMIRQTNSDNILSFRRNSTNYLQLQANGNVDINNGLDVTGDITATGNVAITNTSPYLDLDDSNNNSDYRIINDNGSLKINDKTNSATRLQLHGDGTFDVNGNLDANSGLDVTGNITVSGTVDGRDVATDGTKLDGIASGATNVTNTNQLTNGAGFITSR